MKTWHWVGASTVGKTFALYIVDHGSVLILHMAPGVPPGVIHEHKARGKPSLQLGVVQLSPLERQYDTSMLLII